MPKSSPKPIDEQAAPEAVPTTASKPKVRKRQPEKVIARIIAAATVAFTKDGYKGARLRAIASEAGITIQLLVYHVKTKTQLWQMTMEHIIGQYTSIEDEIGSLPDDATTEDRFRHVITQMVTYMAHYPALHRIMIQEGASPSPRLAWLSERLVRDDLQKFVAMVKEGQKEGVIRAGIDPLRLRYAVVAMASVPFSVAAEYEYFSGISPFAPGEIQKTIEMVLRLIGIED